MKKLAIILALFMVAPLVASADNAKSDKVNFNKPYYNQPDTPQGRRVQYAEKNSAVYKKNSGNEYILKYNVDDLEAAPWLNGGKRKNGYSK
ncbi:hypothetical protein J6G99_08055 [bacterium]|nr:hypothetical protein [bacterium]